MRRRISLRLLPQFLEVRKRTRRIAGVVIAVPLNVVVRSESFLRDRPCKMLKVC